MNKRRVADSAFKTSHEATRHREADALASSFEDAPVLELLVAGGLCGFTPAQMLSEDAA